MFISFEGPEGAGKTTQIGRLSRALSNAGWVVLTSREPGGTPLGDALRGLVLDDPEAQISARAEFLMYSASRAQLVEHLLQPALQRGEVVLLDRYADSSYAYQGAGRGLPLAWLRAVTEGATGGLVPDLSVLLDLDPALGLARAASKGGLDRLERADLGFHTRVRAGFLALAAAEPARFVVLDATRPADDLAADILAITLDRLNPQ
jgi:dTMP kinase